MSLFGREGASGAAGDHGAALVGRYVAQSGDVQSAALLYCHAVHLSRPPRLARFLVQYASLLSRWRLGQLRTDLHDLLAARLPPVAEQGSRGSAALCWHCGDVLAQWPARVGDQSGGTARHFRSVSLFGVEGGAATTSAHRSVICRCAVR